MLIYQNQYKSEKNQEVILYDICVIKFLKKKNQKETNKFFFFPSQIHLISFQLSIIHPFLKNFYHLNSFFMLRKLENIPNY